MNMESERSIRLANPEDLTFIEECTRRAYSKYVAVLGRPARPVMVDYTELLMHSNIWILDLAGTPVGLVVLQKDKSAFLIYSVAVDPDYQHQGHGGFLMRFAEEEAVKARVSHIHLYTNPLMESNVELYRKQGYREVGREPYKGSILVHIDKALGT